MGKLTKKLGPKNVYLLADAGPRARVFSTWCQTPAPRSTLNFLRVPRFPVFGPKLRQTMKCASPTAKPKISDRSRSTFKRSCITLACLLQKRVLQAFDFLVIGVASLGGGEERSRALCVCLVR